MAAAHTEQLGNIPVIHPDLRRWRDAIGEAVMIEPNLDEDGMRAILEADVLPQTLQRDIRSDLRFGFTLKRTANERAIAQLETLVTFLAEERALNDEMEEYDKAAIAASSDGDRYEAIETERQRLREARLALLERGANWGEALQ